MMAQVLFFNGFFQKDPHLNAVEQGFFFSSFSPTRHGKRFLKKEVLPYFTGKTLEF